MSTTIFIGAYGYAQQVLDAFPERPTCVVTIWNQAPMQQRIGRLRAGYDLWINGKVGDALAYWHPVDLVVVAGWRRLVPIVAPTVGFHSAKLPEYPGRAPVANAILRGDKTLTNTMLWLDGGVDSGDIIDSRTFPLGTDPAAAYVDIGRTSAEMLRQHWSGLLDGTAPRHPQDMSRRGPLTPKDAYRRLEART